MQYVTLYEVKRNLGLSNKDTDDAILQDWIVKSSELINLWKGRRYDVVREERRYDTPVSKNLRLGDYGSAYDIDRLFNSDKPSLKVLDLLEVITLTNGDDEEIGPLKYVLKPNNTYPKNRIMLKSESPLQWVPNDDGPEEAISLKGYFGSVTNYGTCYARSGDKLLAEIFSGDTELKVGSYAGVADDLKSPRFQAGQTLRIQSDNGTEFVFIKSIIPGETDYDDDTLEVVRGYNGTIAVDHPVDTEVYIFRPSEIVVQMCLRLVQWRYRQKDSDNFDRVYNLATQSVTTPSALPADVYTILGQRGRMTI